MALVVPFARDERFSERHRILDCVKSTQGVAVLHGPSGVGKTHIAIEYAHRHEASESNASTIWLSSHGFWTINSSIQRLANNLLIQIESSGFNSFLQCLICEPHDQLLLVLDDLSFEAFTEYQKKTLLNFLSNFDPQYGKVLITTRLGPQSFVGDGPNPPTWKVIEVEPFSRDESETMLSVKSITPTWTPAKADMIIEMAQGSPAALQLLATFWQQSNASNDAKLNWEAFECKTCGQSAAAAFEEGLSMAIDLLQLESEDAYVILSYASFLGVQGIPLALLPEAWEDRNPRWTLRLRRSLKKLELFSFIKWSTQANEVFLDEAVRLFMKRRLSEGGTLSASQRRVIQVLATLFVAAPGMRRVCEDLMPHVRQALKYETVDDKDKALQVKLLVQLGTFEKTISALGEAHDLFQSALELQKNMSKGNDLRLLEIEEEIARVLYDQDKLDEAAEHHERIGESYRKLLPPGHYRILMHSADYGLVFMEKGKWDEAGRRLLEGYHAALQIYSVRNGRVLSIKNDIARLYYMKGSYNDSLVEYEELLEEYRSQYVESDPHVFQTISWIARNLKALDRPREAADMYRKAANLAAGGSQVDVEFVLNTRGNLAAALSEIGEIKEAAEEQRKIIDLYKLLEPQPSLKVIRASLNLGVTLERLSSYEDSCRVLEEAEGQVIQLGLSDTDDTTLRIRNSLALGYLRLDQFSRAEERYHVLVATQISLHPDEPDHPDILLVKNNLGGVLQRQHRYPEAIIIQQEVFDSAMKGGGTSRTALFAGTNLAESFRMLAETGVDNKEDLLDKAEKMHRAVLLERERQLGEMWQTWITRVNIGMVLQAKGQIEEALTWYKDLDALAQVVGDHNWSVKVGREKMKILLPLIQRNRTRRLYVLASVAAVSIFAFLASMVW